MADDAATGNDQTAEDTNVTTEAGEGQQPQTVEYSGKQWTPDELKNELERTNAYIKTQFNQQKPEPQEPAQEEDDDIEEPDVTPEQRKALRKLVGADKLEAKLSEYEKREQTREQEKVYNRFQEGLKAINTEAEERGLPKVDSETEQSKLLSFMRDKGYQPHHAVQAYRDMHWSRYQQPVEKKPTATSDRSDAAPAQSDAAYQKALAGAKGDIRKLAEVEAQFKGNPTN